MHWDRNRDDDWRFGRRGDAHLAGLITGGDKPRREQRQLERAALALLREIRLLDPVPTAELRLLVDHVREVHYATNRAFVGQGVRTDYCMVVLEGSVDELRDKAHVATHQAGSFLGLFLSEDVHLAPATLVARTPVRGIVIDRVGLTRAAAGAPGLRAVITEVAAPSGQIAPLPDRLVPRPRTDTLRTPAGVHPAQILGAEA
ncbi:MAG: cyclic nucleotide-binding domain-containing protein [Bacillota bacterium]